MAVVPLVASSSGTDRPRPSMHHRSAGGPPGLDANEAADGKYGAFVTNERVLDTEKYSVGIVA
ncbi:hypothetical protein OG936_16385 [Streptomyces sp. NBC_00846]|uniref:hypothetical protein n=1 Tax=Streptomyces sp. NBC_00846 TaxID=2975849 RepID=UPI00386636F7|nr:hypothetical protein OG936_16385 [Streptomyces sp. NBC_00846]